MQLQWTNLLVGYFRMRNTLFYGLLLSASVTCVHAAPVEQGQCLLVQNGKPQSERVSCDIRTGGSVGKERTSFKVGGNAILIEKRGAVTLVGSDAKSLKDGKMYTRDYETLKVITHPKADQPWLYCAKQVTGKLDACYIMMEY